MERDAVLCGGLSEFTKERFMECSDSFPCWICRECGLLAVANPKSNIWICNGCNNTTNFAQIHMPYASKLLLQELESMCITSRIITAGQLQKTKETLPTIKEY
jgi:DNA-directed RNA polymerase II subunit RPB2